MQLSFDDYMALPVAYESKNRRAEVRGRMVAFFRLTGNVRRSKRGVWPVEACEDEKRAVAAAMAWIEKGRLVVHG